MIDDGPDAVALFARSLRIPDLTLEKCVALSDELGSDTLTMESVRRAAEKLGFLPAPQ